MNFTSCWSLCQSPLGLAAYFLLSLSVSRSVSQSVSRSVLSSGPFCLSGCHAVCICLCNHLSLNRRGATTSPSCQAATLDELGQDQLEQQIYKLPFERGVKCVSIFRYITDHLKALPLSCMTRILNTLGGCGSKERQRCW